MTDGGRSLEGVSVLVVEDEGAVALLIEDMLEDLGCQVAECAASVSEGLTLAETATFDVALLDVNLAGSRVDPIAAVLRRRGKPFAFASGYGAAAVPVGFETAPVLAKPFSQADLERVIRHAIGAAGSR